MIQSYRCLFILIILCQTPFVAADWQEAHPFNVGGSGFINLASDAKGRAAALVGSDTEIKAFNYSEGAWRQNPEGIFPLEKSWALKLAMEPSGRAIGAWAAPNSNGAATEFFDGENWISPDSNPMQGFNVWEVAVAMRGPNEGVLIFVDYLSFNLSVYASFFSSDGWKPAARIGTLEYDHPIRLNVSVAYSSDGTVVAGWGGYTAFHRNKGAFVSHFSNEEWSTVTLDPTGRFRNVGIDRSGKALALWESEGKHVSISTYNGLSWLPSETLATGSNSDLSVSPRGHAIVVYQDSSDKGFSRSFNGRTWREPIPFSSSAIDSGKLGQTLSVSINNSGTAMAVWSTNKHEIRSARLSDASPYWGPEEILHTISPSRDYFKSVNGSISDTGARFAAWEDSTNTESDAFAAAALN